MQATTTVMLDGEISIFHKMILLVFTE